jgi:small-conductance mechanosensitive channel
MKKNLFLLLSFYILFTSSLLAQATSAEVPSSETIASSASEKSVNYAQLSDIPDEAVKLQKALQEISDTLQEGEDVQKMHQEIPLFIDKVNKILHNEIFEDMEYLNIRFIQKKNTEFATYLIQLNEWDELIKSRVDLYDEKQKVLKEYLMYWEETKKHAIKNSAPEAILEQVDKVILQITQLKDKAKAQFDLFLIDSNKITSTSLELTNMRQKLSETELKLSNKLFVQNDMPLYDMLKEKSFDISAYFQEVYRVSRDNTDEFMNYLNAHDDKILHFIIVLFFNGSFVFYFNYLYRKKKLFIRKESLSKKVFFFIKRPFSTLLLLMALSNVIIFPDIPKVVSDLHMLFILIPVFRIIQTVTPRAVLKYFYIFFGLYFMYLFQKNAVSYTLESRFIAIFLTSAFILFIISVVRKKLLHAIMKPVILKAAYRLFAFFVGLLIIAVAANIYGAILLSNKILGAVFIIIYSSLVFYALSVILTGYIVIILRRHMASATNLIEEFSIKVEKTTTLVIRFIMVVWWFKVTLKSIGIYPYLVDFVNSILEFSFQIASTTISIQAIVDFVFIVIGTWLITKFFNAFLEVEIFSRFRFPRGMPTAIKTVVNYAIITTGTIIALSTLGVTPEQFTLVVGALGVGIGFGLRNIIANFVSGIIMVFERPVQIGDTIQVDNTMGSVKSIGARSSTIETFDGSEVIIPNADFIAKEIVNWTLSDERRRKILEFKVDFQSDIDQVLKIMKQVAVEHPDVLKDPEPLATFNGFGEYYLNFKLYFWLTENLIVAQSDIAIGVYKALKEANIKMPTPMHKITKVSADEQES